MRAVRRAGRGPGRRLEPDAQAHVWLGGGVRGSARLKLTAEARAAPALGQAVVAAAAAPARGCAALLRPRDGSSRRPSPFACRRRGTARHRLPRCGREAWPNRAAAFSLRRARTPRERRTAGRRTLPSFQRQWPLAAGRPERWSATRSSRGSSSNATSAHPRSGWRARPPRPRDDVERTRGVSVGASALHGQVGELPRVRSAQCTSH